MSDDAYSRGRGEHVMCFFYQNPDHPVPSCPGAIRGEKHVNLHKDETCAQGRKHCRENGCKPKYAHQACAQAAGALAPPL
jgi:hypothetical protein